MAAELGINLCEYGPFGELLRATGPMAKANALVHRSLGGGGFRFSTKYQDDETDLVYYGLRYLKTSTGGWLNRDPIGENGGLNLYEFIDNDPSDAIDTLSAKKSIPWQDYWNSWKNLHPGLDPSQLSWAEQNLARGCIGVTCVNLGDQPNFQTATRQKPKQKLGRLK